MSISLPADDELSADTLREARSAPLKGQLFAHIAQVAATWDGTNPIRKL